MDRHTEIYPILDNERDYQDEKWDHSHDNHEVEAYILYMEHYLHEARKAVSVQSGTKGGLDMMRKVVALGIRCFEKHGVPDRHWFSQDGTWHNAKID